MVCAPVRRDNPRALALSHFYHNNQCRSSMLLDKLQVPGRPTIWITVGQGPTAPAVGTGGGCLDIFTLIFLLCPLPPSLWEMARYRLKYCLKGRLNPKTTKQLHITEYLVLTIGYLVIVAQQIEKMLVGCFGFTALSDSISVYIGPSPREREREGEKVKRNDRREKICPNSPHPHLLKTQ